MSLPLYINFNSVFLYFSASTRARIPYHQDVPSQTLFGTKVWMFENVNFPSELFGFTLLSQRAHTEPVVLYLDINCRHKWRAQRATGILNCRALPDHRLTKQDHKMAKAPASELKPGNSRYLETWCDRVGTVASLDRWKRFLPTLQRLYDRARNAVRTCSEARHGKIPAPLLATDWKSPLHCVSLCWGIKGDQHLEGKIKNWTNSPGSTITARLWWG